jgi:hypothetical protein
MFWRNRERIGLAAKVLGLLWAGQQPAGIARHLYPGPGTELRICDHGLRTNRETTGSVSSAQKEETPMSQNKFPDEWDEGRAQRVLAHYAEDEAGVSPPRRS